MLQNSIAISENPIPFAAAQKINFKINIRQVSELRVTFTLERQIPANPCKMETRTNLSSSRTHYKVNHQP